jgi:hypothetical protein
LSGDSSPTYSSYSATATATTTNPVALGHKIHYVSPSGSNGNNGSQNSPWQTLQYATATGQLSCGDLLYVASGSYPNDTIKLDQQCSANNRVVVAAAPGGSIVNITSPSGYNTGIWLDGSYGVLDGLALTANVGGGNDVLAFYGGSHYAILGGNFTGGSIPNNVLAVVHMYGGANNLFYGNYIHDGGSDPGDNDYVGGSGWILDIQSNANNNVIWSNHLTRGGHDNTLIKGGYQNKWVDNIADGGWGQGFANVWDGTSDPQSGNNLLEGNVIFHAGYMPTYYKPAIQLSYGYNTVRRNIVMGSQVAVEESALEAGSDQNNLVYNNTFYTSWPNGGSCWWQSHNNPVPPSYGGSVFANNICYPLTASGPEVTIYLSDQTQRITHNDYLYVSGATFSNGILTEGTPAPNQAIITYDQQNENAATQQADCGTGNYSCQYPVTLLSADTKGALTSGNYNAPFSNNAAYSVVPTFVNPAAYDFHLTSGTPLIGGGLVISDPQFAVPAGTWDIGAYGIPSTTGGALPDILKRNSTKTSRGR